MDSRAAFEAWWAAEYESHTYQHDDARNMAWEGWQASRLAALEEAASALQKKGDGLTKASGFRSGYMKATYDAADDIRALAQGGGK